MPSSTSSSTSTAAAAAATAPLDKRALPSFATVERMPMLAVSDAEQTQYDRVAAKLLHKAAHEYRRYVTRGSVIDPMDWSNVRSNSEMAIYRSTKATATPRASVLLGVGKLDGAFEDVLDGLYNDTSSDLRTMKSLRKYKCIVGSVLHVSATRTPADPFTFAGIKWLASKMPVLSDDRDLLTYERQGLVVDAADGTDVAYHVMLSIDRPEWPANAFQNVIRSHTDVCFLYRRSGQSRVDVFVVGEHFTSGRVPHVVLDYAIAGKWLSVTMAARCAAAKKLSQLQAIMRARTAESRGNGRNVVIDMTRCHLCEQRPGFFSQLQRCSCCQQSVCRSCSLDRKFFALDAGGQPVVARVCKHCVTIAAKQRGSKIAWTDKAATPAPVAFTSAFEPLPRASGSSDASPNVSVFAHDLAIDTSYLDQALRPLDGGGASMKATASLSASGHVVA